MTPEEKARLEIDAQLTACGFYMNSALHTPRSALLMVHLCREVFGKGNDFCKKITYQATQWLRRPAADSEGELLRRPAAGSGISAENSGEAPLPRRQKGRDLIKVQRPLRPTTIRRRRTRRGGEADTFCNSTMPRIAVTRRSNFAPSEVHNN